MKLSKTLKRLIFTILIIYILFSVPHVVQAADGTTMLSTMQSQTSAFISKGQANASGISWQAVTQEFVGLGQILTMIGVGVMVAVVAYMGIKYLTAGPEAQAKLKVQLIGLLVSAMVIFGSYYIWKFVVGIAETF